MKQEVRGSRSGRTWTYMVGIIVAWAENQPTSQPANQHLTCPAIRRLNKIIPKSSRINCKPGKPEQRDLFAVCLGSAGGRGNKRRLWAARARWIEREMCGKRLFFLFSVNVDEQRFSKEFQIHNNSSCLNSVLYSDAWLRTSDMTDSIYYQGQTNNL